MPAAADHEPSLFEVVFGDGVAELRREHMFACGSSSARELRARFWFADQLTDARCNRDIREQQDRDGGRARARGREHRCSACERSWAALKATAGTPGWAGGARTQRLRFASVQNVNAGRRSFGVAMVMAAVRCSRRQVETAQARPPPRLRPPFRSAGTRCQRFPIRLSARPGEHARIAAFQRSEIDCGSRGRYQASREMGAPCGSGGGS